MSFKTEITRPWLHAGFSHTTFWILNSNWATDFKFVWIHVSQSSIGNTNSNGCNLSRVRVRRTRDTGYRVAQDT
jgi:hypothetical protein